MYSPESLMQILLVIAIAFLVAMAFYAIAAKDIRHKITGAFARLSKKHRRSIKK